MNSEASNTQRVTEIAEREAPALLAFFARRVTPRQDAADLTSETLLVLWRRADAIPSADAEVRPWLYGIARRVLQRHVRTSMRRSALVERIRDALSQTPDVGFDRSDDAREVRTAVARLAPKDRELIMLVHWDGFSVTEAAAILGMNASTARTRSARARGALRAMLADDEVPTDSVPNAQVRRI